MLVRLFAAIAPVLIVQAALAGSKLPLPPRRPPKCPPLQRLPQHRPSLLRPPRRPANHRASARPTSVRRGSGLQDWRSSPRSHRRP
jgi:hypothetical protein